MIQGKKKKKCQRAIKKREVVGNFTFILQSIELEKYILKKSYGVEFCCGGMHNQLCHSS